MLKNEDYYINLGISKLKGQVQIGDVVAHISNKIAFELVDIVGNKAYCEYPKGNIVIFPVNEIFDVNKLKSLCIELVIEDRLNPDDLQN